MKLIAGLGNPGSRYAFTRHNIGFIIVDYLCLKHNLKLLPAKGDWYEAKFEMGDTAALLIKPSSYMNNSGLAVRDCMETNGINQEDLLVVVDDFQLPLGTIRLRKKGSDGGHNGLSSIAYELATEDFARLRIGIGESIGIRKEDYVDFVLGKFTEDESAKIDKLLSVYAECVESFILHGATRTMNNYNKSYLETNAENSDQEQI